MPELYRCAPLVIEGEEIVLLARREETPGFAERAQALLGALEQDRLLLREKGTDSLPRSAVARHLTEAVRRVYATAGLAPPEASSLFFCLSAALVDVLCNELDAPLIVAWGAGVYWRGHPTDMVWTDMSTVALAPLATELARQVPGDSAVAIAGVGEGLPITGFADSVACVARSATLAASAARVIGNAVRVECVESISRPSSLPGDSAGPLTAEVGTMQPEQVWDALSAGVRVAQNLRSRGLVSHAVLTLKGRGRLLGAVEGDRLMRFGVSRWR